MLLSMPPGLSNSWRSQASLHDGLIVTNTRMDLARLWAKMPVQHVALVHPIVQGGI